MKKLSGFYKGVNLGGWLSQCVHTKEHYDSFIQDEDFRELSGWGLDHLRLPVDYNLLENDDGSYKEDGFLYIDYAIKMCREIGLSLILDLHKTYGFSFDKGEGELGFFENEQYRERFCRLWEKLAKRYAKHSDMLAFELLNEVTDKSYCDIWNETALNCIKRIRAIAPDNLILVGGYHNNSAEAVKDLLYIGDDKLVYNFHCYDPLRFTHQGAYWVEDMDRDFKMSFEESGVTEKFFEDFFADAIKTSNERGVPLYCGEYGVIETVDVQQALPWYKALHSVFEKYNIGHAVWTYKKMDFGLSSPSLSVIKNEIISHK